MLFRRALAAAGNANWLLHQPVGPIQLASAAGAGAGAAAGPPPAAVRGYASDADVRQAFSYCVQQVKQHDYENYLWVTQLDKALRPALFVLRAFNVETALIGDHAKSETLLLMRCQWWRDAINDCYKGRPPPQPVVTALAEVLRHAPLTRYRLQQIVSTREADLQSAAQPASLADLERYAEGTAVQLLLLQLEAAGVSSGGDGGGCGDDGGGGGCGGGGGAGPAAAAEHAAAHLGKAVGLAGLLRGTYAAGSQRRVYLPADLCLRHGVAPGDVLAGRDSEGLRDVALAVATAAQQHLDAARRLAADVPPAARPLGAPAVAAGMYLGALQAAGFNLFDPALMRAAGPYSLLAYQLRLKWALLRNQY